jgi:hypothetical protein
VGELTDKGGLHLVDLPTGSHAPEKQIASGLFCW